LFISPFSTGKTHDFTLFKNLFKSIDFKGLNLWVDLGFLGIKKFSKAPKIQIPHKASKNHPLSIEQKAENCILSSIRVVIENTIAMLKRYFILRIQNRMKLKNKLDDAVEICANLWNFKRKFKTENINH
jgi:hypothetical protein